VPFLDPADVHGKRIAMIVWGEKPDGSDDVAVFTGVARWDGAHLRMVRQPGPDFPVRDDWLDRLKPVDAELKATLLGAELAFSVSIGNLPEGIDVEELLSTGLEWPDDDDPS